MNPLSFWFIFNQHINMLVSPKPNHLHESGVSVSGVKVLHYVRPTKIESCVRNFIWSEVYTWVNTNTNSNTIKTIPKKISTREKSYFAVSICSPSLLAGFSLSNPPSAMSTSLQKHSTSTSGKSFTTENNPGSNYVSKRKETGLIQMKVNVAASLLI